MKYICTIRRVSVSLVAAVLLLAISGCGNSANPENWEEAEAKGAVEVNFIEACHQANEQSSGNPMNAATAERYCRCAYNGLRNEFTFAEFKALDDALRADPNPSDLDDEGDENTEANWDDKAEQILRDCIPRSVS